MAGRTPKPDDIVIAVMGLTGVGKSTFIQQFTSEKVPVSSSLQSCTQKVGVYYCYIAGLPRFFMVDTPGFDDTNRSDSEVLRELSQHLANAYKVNITLTGLIYLHRIMDVRFSGASGRNLRTFRKLTGQENLHSVVLGTTFWNSPPSAEDAVREAQLNSDTKFGWSRMIKDGATYMRQDQDSVSGKAIVKHLIDRRKRVVLQVQKEIVDQNKRIDETEAASEMIMEIRRAYERRFDDLKRDVLEAQRERDRQWQTDLDVLKAELQREREKEERGIRSLSQRMSDWWDDIDCIVM